MNKEIMKIKFCRVNLFVFSLASSLLLLIFVTDSVQGGHGHQSTFTRWLNTLYRPKLSPNWQPYGEDEGSELLGQSQHLNFDHVLDPYQRHQVPNTNIHQPPNFNSPNKGHRGNYGRPNQNMFSQRPTIANGGRPQFQQPQSQFVVGGSVRVPGLLENVDSDDDDGDGGTFDGGFSGQLGGGGGFGTFQQPRDPPRPTIQIGAPPPPNYRLMDNFQQSFQVLLMPQRDWATQSYYGAPSPQSGGFGIGSSGNEGSIITANRIYYSPEISAPRSQPFQVGRRLPPLREPNSGLSAEEQTTVLLHNISSVIQDRNIGVTNADKTIAVIHLQSYSILTPDRMRKTNDSDIIEAQEYYGFPANSFKFGSTHTIVSVFKKLLDTNFDGVAASGGLDGSDAIGRIRNFVNATQKIHFWAHGQGEEDAMLRFSFTPRDNNVTNTDATFIDTAPVTDTLSAVVF